MENLKLNLNFVPLRDQSQELTIYRKIVKNTATEKDGVDYRVKPPENPNENDWKLFDISINSKQEYEEFNCQFSLNPRLATHIIYERLIKRLGEPNKDIKFHIPDKDIFRKEVSFVYKKYEEGTSDIVVMPYFLKERKLFGFLLKHKFSLKENQPFNRKVQILSFSLDKSGRPNVYFYKDKKSELEGFINSMLAPLLSGTCLDFEKDFASIAANKLEVKTYLVGNSNTNHSQFMGIKFNGPHRKITEDVRYLFLFSEQTKSLARDIYLGLVGKLFPGQFSGLEKMFLLPMNKDIVEHCLIDTFDKPSLDEIKKKINDIKFSSPQDKLIILAVIPKGFKDVDESFDIYGHLKLMALENNVYCQIATEDTFYKKDQLKWSISNIGLQMFSKLGGVPWLVKPAKNNCLIFGIGNVQEYSPDDQIKKYTAYTICVDSSGDFKYIKPLSSAENESDYLNNLKSNLQEVLSSELGTGCRSLVIHIPYKIKRLEVEAIKEVVSSIRKDNDIEVIIIRVNTEHQFFGFSDHNTCVPYESTYVQLSKNEFLLWAEGLQYGKEVLHKRTSSPLYINFIESREEWATRRDCLQDILNLTGANWRGFNAKAQPISIYYSRLIARFMKSFSHLENMQDINIVSAESNAPWFL